MIKHVTGDILKANVQAFVNPVNCVGVAGAGLAKQFKRTFTGNFHAYALACRVGLLHPGRVFTHFCTLRDDMVPPCYIINFPTKRHWRDASRIEDIEAGLVALKEEIRSRDIASVAVPALGCGLGGLDWKDVKPLIERALGDLDARILVYGPMETKGDSE